MSPARFRCATELYYDWLIIDERRKINLQYKVSELTYLIFPLHYVPVFHAFGVKSRLKTKLVGPVCGNPKICS
jgi:hypothetical protein